MTKIPTNQTKETVPSLTKSLPPHELDKHRAAVCLVMEVMVRKHDKFGWDQMNAGMRQMIREDWLAALSDYPVQEVREACRMHTQEAPNKVPNEGHIKAIIVRERKGPIWDDLSDSQRLMLERLQCPPSMMVDGKPNAKAVALMAQVRQVNERAIQ